MNTLEYSDSDVARNPETDYLMRCTSCHEVGPLESFDWIPQENYTHMLRHHQGCSGHIIAMRPNSPLENPKYIANCPDVIYRDEYDKLCPEEQAELCAKIKQHYVEGAERTRIKALAYDAQIEAKKRAQELLDAGKPKCPTCKSTNIRRISMLSRGLSVGFFGLASDKIGKQFQCDNCGYKW